jgi:hypothetical protein
VPKVPESTRAVKLPRLAVILSGAVFGLVQGVSKAARPREKPSRHGGAPPSSVAFLEAEEHDMAKAIEQTKNGLTSDTVASEDPAKPLGAPPREWRNAEPGMMRAAGEATQLSWRAHGNGRPDWSAAAAAP